MEQPLLRRFHRLEEKAAHVSPGDDLQGARDKLGVLHKRNGAEFDFDKEKAERARKNGKTFAEWADECIKLQRDGVKIAKRAIKGSTLEREVECVAHLKRFFGEIPAAPFVDLPKKGSGTGS